MLITQELPDFPPRPLTEANRAWREKYVRNWGSWHALLGGRSRYEEYWTRTVPGLSIKTVRQGTESFFVGHRTVTIDDETYLVLNDGQRYGGALQSPTEAESLCIFYRVGYPESVARALAATAEQVSEQQDPALPVAVEFNEHLRPHDTLVSPWIARIRDAVFAGVRDAFWFEEQLDGLLLALFAADRQWRGRALRLEAVRPSTRAELLRRVSLAADYLHSHYAEPVSLDELARAAHLSKFHLVRLFRQVHGLSPHAFLQAKRGRAAHRLLTTTALPVGEVMAQCGFAERSGLLRQLRRQFGANASVLRERARRAR